MWHSHEPGSPISYAFVSILGHLSFADSKGRSRWLKHVSVHRGPGQLCHVLALGLLSLTLCLLRLRDARLPSNAAPRARTATTAGAGTATG